MVTFQNKAGLIMKVAGILRGVFKPDEYDKMILPDEAKSKIGYEINFTRYFHEYTPLRKTSNILQDFQGIQRDVSMFLKDLFGTSSDKGEVASD